MLTKYEEKVRIIETSGKNSKISTARGIWRIWGKKRKKIKSVNKRKGNNMKKRVIAVIAVLALSVAMFGCKAGSDTGNGKKQREESAGDMGTEGKATAEEETEIQVFIAASLNKVMTELAKEYQKDHPNVKIIYNADSSGTLLTQIEEGYECDLFFSAVRNRWMCLKQTDFL